MASGRPAFGSRFNTGNIEPALLARGFHYGTAPNSVVIGWNGGHAAVTLPDGTPVSSGEGNSGVRIGGGGAYQPQFNHHMYLPVQADTMNASEPATLDADGAPVVVDDAPASGEVVVIDIASTAGEAVPEAVPEAAAPDTAAVEAAVETGVETEQVPA